MGDGNVEYVRIKDIAEDDRKLSALEEKVLDEINDKIASGNTLEDILNYLFEASKDIYPCDRISIAFLEDNGQRAVAYRTRTSYQPVYLKEGFWQDMSDSTLRKVIDENCPRIIHDIPLYAGKKPDSPSAALLLKEKVRSSMTCPINANGEVIGFMFRSSRNIKAYNHHTVYLHYMAVLRLSQALEKAFIIDKLRKVNSSYSEILSFVNHELKSPLAGIITDCTMLLGNYTGKLSGKQKNKVGKILAKAEYTMNFVKDYLNLAKAENSAENLKKKKTDVGHLLEAALDMAEPAFDEKNMRPRNYSAGQPFTAECEPGLIGVVFNNLINNSIKYGFEKTEVQCVLKTADNKLFFSIRNEGPGFPKSEKGKLFRKFSRISSPEFKDVPGTGVGLYTVWKIINMHGGGISASSEPGKWAQFEFEIPRGKI